MDAMADTSSSSELAAMERKVPPATAMASELAVSRRAKAMT